MGAIVFFSLTQPSISSMKLSGRSLLQAVGNGCYPVIQSLADHIPLGLFGPTFDLVSGDSPAWDHREW
jgi:hypothetical protein